MANMPQDGGLMGANKMTLRQGNCNLYEATAETVQIVLEVCWTQPPSKLCRMISYRVYGDFSHTIDYHGLNLIELCMILADMSPDITREDAARYLS